MHNIPSVCILVGKLTRVGGTEKQAIRLASVMARLGARVSIITFGKFKQKLEISSENIYVIPGKLIPPATIGAIFYVLWVLLLLILHRHKYQVIFAQGMVVEGVIGCLARNLLKNKRVVVKIASAGYFGDLSMLQKSWLSTLRQSLLRRADAFVALTPEVKAELESWGYPPAKIWSIPNGVDIQIFRPFDGDLKDLRQRIGIEPDAQWVLFVGRFVAKKRVGFLIETWQYIQRVKPMAQLILVGTGPLAEEVKNQVKRLGLSNTIHFMGTVDNVVPILQASDVFVLPSVSEGLSNALLEAMACGLPVVTTNTLGTRSVLEDGKEGLLFQETDKDMLTDHLLTLLNDPILAKKLGRQGRIRVEQTFSLNRIAENYLNAFRGFST